MIESSLKFCFSNSEMCLTLAVALRDVALEPGTEFINIRDLVTSNWFI